MSAEFICLSVCLTGLLEIQEPEIDGRKYHYCLFVHLIWFGLLYYGVVVVCALSLQVIESFSKNQTDSLCSNPEVRARKGNAPYQPDCAELEGI